MEFENDVKTVIAEMAEELNKNYSDQKLFDLSLGDRRRRTGEGTGLYPKDTGGAGVALQRCRSRI